MSEQSRQKDQFNRLRQEALKFLINVATLPFVLAISVNGRPPISSGILEFIGQGVNGKRTVGEARPGTKGNGFAYSEYDEKQVGFGDDENWQMVEPRLTRGINVGEEQIIAPDNSRLEAS